ncbi:tyrosine-protein phosphatase (plasmid) [Streptomyces sp. AHU1]|uniref:tyrosine-protein phosphatase n=1 Tax=Streptomyces sp. AHU1 TaxID=3377215 RepID=UPI0038779316
MPTESLAGTSTADRAWPVLPNLLVAGARTEAWELPPGPITVVSLSRTPLDADVYARAATPPLRVLHRPFTYWESKAPVTLLDSLVQEISVLAARERTLVHCTLGLDRTGVVALALLLRHTGTLNEALRRYRARGVRLPRQDAMDVLTSYAHRAPTTTPDIITPRPPSTTNEGTGHAR